MKDKRKSTGKVARKILRKETYTDIEKKQMTALQSCYAQTHPEDSQSPLFKMNEEGTKPLHVISKQDMLKPTWIKGQKGGLLQTEADSMIGVVCEYLSYRSDQGYFSKGHRNDPEHLTCSGFLHWLAFKLWSAPCDETTLAMVEAELRYLESVQGANIFKEGDFSEKTMVSVMTQLRRVLQEAVIPTIKREIANTHAREHLSVLRVQGKEILMRGFQFLYYILRNTEDTPTANIPRLRRRERAYCCVADTRSGKLLDALIQSPPYRTIFQEEHEQSAPNKEAANNAVLLKRAGTHRRLSPRQAPTASNVFLTTANKLCIPYSLLKEQTTQSDITFYLCEDSTLKKFDDTGIYPAFMQNSEMLETFIEMHALLQELAKVFLACDEACDLAGVGGDILVYGISNKQINLLMDTLKKLCEALVKCQNKLSTLADHRLRQLTTDNLTERTEHKAWVKNYREVHIIQGKLVAALEVCQKQTDFVKEKANTVLSTDWIEQAKDKTNVFAETTALLNTHVDHFLNRVATPLVEAAWVTPDLSMVRQVHAQASTPEEVAPVAKEHSAEGGLRKAPSSPRGTLLSRVFSSNKTKPQTQVQDSVSSDSQENEDLPIVVSPSPPPSVSPPSASPRMSIQTVQLFGIHNPIRGQRRRVYTDENIEAALQYLLPPDLESIELQNNELTAASAARVCQYLMPLEQLIKIDLCGNKAFFCQTPSCKVDPAKAMSDLLIKNRKIREIRLVDCGLKSHSMSYIAKGILENNKTLEILDLSNNDIETEGGLEICRALEKANQLTHFAINNAGLTDEVGHLLLDLMRRHPSLIIICIENKFSPGVALSINDAVNEKMLRLAAKK